MNETETSRRMCTVTPVWVNVGTPRWCGLVATPQSRRVSPRRACTRSRDNARRPLRLDRERRRRLRGFHRLGLDQLQCLLNRALELWVSALHDEPRLDRKSTRLNSSHGYISYA